MLYLTRSIPENIFKFLIQADIQKSGFQLTYAIRRIGSEVVFSGLITIKRSIRILLIRLFLSIRIKNNKAILCPLNTFQIREKQFARSPACRALKFDFASQRQ